MDPLWAGRLWLFLQHYFLTYLLSGKVCLWWEEVGLLVVSIIDYWLFDAGGKVQQGWMYRCLSTGFIDSNRHWGTDDMLATAYLTQVLPSDVIF